MFAASEQGKRAQATEGRRPGQGDDRHARQGHRVRRPRRQGRGPARPRQVSDPEGKLLVKLGDVVEARVSSDAGGVLVSAHEVGARTGSARRSWHRHKSSASPSKASSPRSSGAAFPSTLPACAGSAGVADRRALRRRSLRVHRPAADVQSHALRAAAPNLVLSRRALLEEENEKRATETRKHLVPGAVIRGRGLVQAVRRVRRYRRPRGHAARRRSSATRASTSPRTCFGSTRSSTSRS